MNAHTWPSGTFANGTAERKIATDTRTTASASRRSPGPAGSVDTNTRRPSAVPPAMLCLDPCVVRRSSADVAENDSSLVSSAYGNPARKGNNTFVVAPGALELPDDLAALREEAPGRVVRLPARHPRREPPRQVVREEVRGRAVREKREAHDGLP